MSVEIPYGQAVDAIVSALIRPQRPSMPPESLRTLHDAGAALASEPMPLAAARRIVSTVKRGDWVLLLTGVYDPINLPYGETDGPPGAAALARALDVGLGAKPVVICEEQVMGSIELTAVAAGLLPVRDRGHAAAKAHSVLLQPFPIISPSESEAEAARLFAALSPTAVISVERIGGNVKGRHHYANGAPLRTQAYLESLVELARERGLATVGVGDGGNEIGMGNMLATVQEVMPAGRQCQCDCGAGIACAVPVDVLVVANTSNLGAYGIAACIGILLNQPRLIHDREIERRLLEAVAAAKCMDGGFVSPSVDGTGDTSLAVVELLQRIVAFACT